MIDPRIPSSAQKVFSGIRSDIYQWDQELYDGSRSTFECIRFLDGAFVIATTEDGKILLTKQEQPARDHFFFSLPWWSFDFPDEDPLLCAKRELLEETWYGEWEWGLYFTAKGTHNVIAYTYFYIARSVKKIAELQPDAWEKIELLFLDFDEFISYSENSYFSHWPLLPHLFWAKLHREKYDTLKEIIFGKK